MSHFSLALFGLALTALPAQAQFTLSSTLTYTGRQTGSVWIAPSANGSTLIMSKKIPLGALPNQPFTSLPFALTNLDEGGTYHIFAWRDSDGNGAPSATEAQGWHPDSPFLMDSNRTVSGFVIADPDVDADGLPDWWEANYGLTNRMGSGRSGALLLHPGQTNFTDSVWASVVGSNPSGSAILNVSSTNGFVANDLVLIMIMQDTNRNLTLNAAGTYEFGRIASLSQGGGVTNLTLTSAYTNAFTPATSQRIQVLKVSEYTEMNLAGSALTFYGTNIVRMTNFGWSMPTNEVTVEVWLRVVTNKYQWPVLFYLEPDLVANRFLAHLGSRYPGNFYTYWDFGAIGNGGRIAYYSTPAVGSWQHYAFVASKSGNFMKVFLNGVENYSLPTFSATAFVRGQYDLLLGLNFVGDMDEFRVWNKARTQAEIQSDMNHSLTGSEPDLLAYYRLDEGSGTNVLDATGHGHNGTWDNVPAWVPPGTLTCRSWNGTNGGVLAFQAYQVTLGSNSVITADGKGYRGGPDYAQADVDGYQGESFAGTWPLHSITNNFGGGGGGGRSGYAGGNSGAGGAHGSPGVFASITPANFANNDRGTTIVPAFGGNSYGTAPLPRIFMGSGGGSGGQDANDAGDANYNGGVGGAGGGIVLCSAGFIKNVGKISASGQDGSSLETGERGVGGGGAGGSVYITANWQSSGGVLQAKGGLEGRSSTWPGMNGGAGGVGRIRLDVPPGAVAPLLEPAAGFIQLIPVNNAAGPAMPLWSPYDDTDQDGLSDLREYALDTNPLSADTDGDTLPDAWEVAYGLNPRSTADAIAGQDADGDGVPNLIEFQRGTRPDLMDTDYDGLTDAEELFVYHTNPLEADTDGDGMDDDLEVAVGTDPLSNGIQYFYDPNDRLIGVQYENGLALGYAYDRNDNLVRQTYMQRDGNANGLPDVWEFMNGLTNNTSSFADTDGDGWSDYQEWQAGTNPLDPNNKPETLGTAGTNLLSINWPFTPANFVVGVGQLDGLGAEEIVISADGNPGTTNFLLILSQSVSNWSTEWVPVGSNGVSSLAIGQPANRVNPAIYVGLRRPGGAGCVVEITGSSGQWSQSTIATSTSEAGFVLGVRPERDVVVSLAQSSAPVGSPWYLAFDASAWALKPAATNTSQRGLGTITLPGLHGLTSRGVRLLDNGGLHLLGDEKFVPINAVWHPDYSRWFFKTTNSTTWEACENYARVFGGDLVTVTDAALDSWLWTTFPGDNWIGLRAENFNCAGPYLWASGQPVIYTHWGSGQPNGCALAESVVSMWAGAGWGDWARTTIFKTGIVEVARLAGPSVAAAEPPAAQYLLWRGHSLNAGTLRLSGSASVVYTFVDDKNLNDLMDDGDELVVAEYLYGDSALVPNSSIRIPLSGSSLAQSYGLASVALLSANQQALFTAEPDGRVFSWTAPDSTSPLQRQLFSAQHRGKAWHALVGVTTLSDGECLAGLRVEPAAPNQCALILWPPQRQLWAPTEVPQTAPVTEILPSPAQGRDIARVDIRIWDAEGDMALPELEFQTNATTWSTATLAAIDTGGHRPVASSPSGVVHQLSWDAARDLGSGFTNTVTLHARAHDITLTGNWSPPLAYSVQNSLANNPRAFADVAMTSQAMAVDINVLVNDTVEHGAPKLIASVGVPAHGSATTNLNQTIRYIPAPNFIGTDQFVYTLTDGAGAFSMATVTVTVTPGAAGILLQSPVVTGNHFAMNILGSVGQVYRVQATGNFTGWSDVTTLTNVTGTAVFTEQFEPNSPTRFYRVVLVGP